MDLLTRMVEHHVWLTGEMVARAERLDRAQLDEPIELYVEVDDDATLRSLLSRLVGQMGMWNAAMAQPRLRLRVEEHESLTSMRAPARRRGPAYLAHVREVVDEQPPRRHLRRRALRAARGVHLRRHDRPRAHVRGAPADAGARRPRQRRHPRPRPGDPMRWVANGA